MDRGNPNWTASESYDTDATASLARPYVEPGGTEHGHHLAPAHAAAEDHWWRRPADDYQSAEPYDAGGAVEEPPPWSTNDSWQRHPGPGYIDPPPPFGSSRAGAGVHTRARRRSGVLGAFADGLDRLSPYRRQAMVAAGAVVVLAVLTAVVDTALDEPRPGAVAEFDLDVRASSIPYADVPTAGFSPAAPPVFEPGPSAPPVSDLPAPPAGGQPAPAPTPGAAAPTGAAGSPQPVAGRPTTAGAPPAADPPPARTPAAPPPPAQPAGRMSAYSTIQAENYDAQQGTGTESSHDRGGGLLVGLIAGGDWLLFRGVDFSASAANRVQVRAASGAPDGFRGRIEVRLDSRSAEPVGGFTIGGTGNWYDWRTVDIRIQPVTGVHNVYITFTADHPVEFANVNWFTFVR